MLQRSILSSFALFVFSLCSPCLVSTALAGDIDLVWSPNSEPDLNGYRLYFGTQSGVYDAPGSPVFIPSPNTTTTITGLQNDQQYFFTITALDLSNNESIPAVEIDTVVSENPPSDTTPPSIPSVDSIIANSATNVTISWSEATDDVGVTGYTLYRDGNSVITGPTTSFTDSNLAPETTYIYTVKAHDAANNSSALSAEAPITTPALPDTTPPTISITSPADNDTVSGIVTISGTASDNVGVMGVQFQLDGANLGTEDTTSTYGTDWDTSSVTPGPHTLTAIARDAANNTSTAAAITVTVDLGSETEANDLEVTNMQIQSGKAYVVMPDGLIPNAVTYIDRSYLFKSIPTPLTSTTYIQTANTDKNSTSSSFLTFDVNQPVTIYIAHDDRISPKPTWLDTFTNTGDILITSDTDFEIYSQTYPAGTITLGGNRPSGKGGSMYSVAIVTEGGSTADTTPPTSPLIDSAVANSATDVTISWSGATDNVGVTGYTLYRDGNSIANPTTTSYTDFNLTPETVYAYTVMAHDAANNLSDISAEASVTTPALPDTTPPSTPSIDTVVANSATQITITWNEATDNVEVTGYTLYRDGTPIITTLGTSHIETNMTPETTYLYAVNAHDAASNSSDISAEVPVTTPAPPDTSPPSVTLTTPSEGEIVTGIVTISATATDNVGIIGVQFQLDGINLGTEDTTSEYSLNWDTSSVTPGTHTLTALARDAADNTTVATPVNVEVGSPALEISNLNVQSGKAYVVVPDGLINNAVTYIDRSYLFKTIPTPLTSTTYIQTANTDKNTTGSSLMSFDVNQPVTVYIAHDDRISPKPTWLSNFTPTGETLLTSDTDLDIYSQTFPAGTITLGGNRPSGKGGSMYSVAIVTEGGSTADTTPPTSPSIDSAVANSATDVTIFWSGATDNVGVTGYTLYRDGSSIANPTTTSYIDSNLTPETVYTYTVIAHDAANNTSALSAEASITTPAQSDTTPPSIPSILSAIADSSTQATISWEAASDNVGVTGYNLYRDAILISTTTGLNYVDSGLTPFTSYDYTIEAVDGAGNVSGLSSAISVTTEDGNTNNSGTAQLSWQKSPESDLSHYVVYYGTSSQVYDQVIPVGLTPTPNAPSYTISDLAPGTYYFTVRAVDTSGNLSPPAPEGIKTITN